MYQVRIRETNVGEPLFKRREVLNDVKTWDSSVPWDKFNGNLKFWLNGIRRSGGVTLNQALVQNVRPCAIDVKGDIRGVDTHKDKVLMLLHRFGVTHSSEEGMETCRSKGVTSICFICLSTAVGGMSK